jgi:hypothetical protein
MFDRVRLANYNHPIQSALFQFSKIRMKTETLEERQLSKYTLVEVSAVIDGVER